MHVHHIMLGDQGLLVGTMQYSWAGNVYFTSGTILAKPVPEVFELLFLDWSQKHIFWLISGKEFKHFWSSFGENKCNPWGPRGWGINIL